MIINKNDNVRVDIASGHKYAIHDIKKGEPVIKYGYPIGNATCDITEGDHVHTHNVKTGLSDLLTYTYTPKLTETKLATEIPTFMGYRRKNGDVAIRNEVWVIPTVGCVNKSAKAIAEKTGAYCFEHPYGCSQLGDDQLTTQKILCGLINHPNAAAVLVLGLGCENSNIDEIKKVLGKWDDERVKFLVSQDVEDEIETGIAIVRSLKLTATALCVSQSP